MPARGSPIRLPVRYQHKYDSPTLDLQEAGRAMHVTGVVTGHYMKEGDQLQITLEAVDVADNRTLWRDTRTVGSGHDFHAQSDHGESSPRIGPSSWRRNGFRGSWHVLVSTLTIRQRRR